MWRTGNVQSKFLLSADVEVALRLRTGKGNGSDPNDKSDQTMSTTACGPDPLHGQPAGNSGEGSLKYGVGCIALPTCIKQALTSTVIPPLAGLGFYTNPFEVKYSTMTATDWVTSSSFVLR